VLDLYAAGVCGGMGSDDRSPILIQPWQLVIMGVAVRVMIEVW
jgi:hypothetical protein